MTPEEVRQEWVAALRSGEYEQTIGKLHDQDGFCCLGVLCDLYGAKTGKGQWSTGTPLPGIVFVTGKELGAACLPQSVIEWAGLDSDDGRFTGDDGYPCSLAELNDFRLSFETIASIIEQEPDGLVTE